MALKGRLGELPLLDILQIVAFSKKTGSLLVRGPGGKGVVVFKDGHVLCAYSPSTIDFLHRFDASGNAEQAEALLLQQIQMALREIAALKEGVFRFEVTRELPGELFGVDLTAFYRHKGIDTQRVLLSLAKEMDDERRETTALFESAFHSAQPAETSREAGAGHGPRPGSSDDMEHTVVLVDDEPLVTRIIGAELQSRGHQVVTASSPAEGVSAVRREMDSGNKVIVAADLRMPTTTGRSFYGGFELARTLRLSGWRLPFVLMTEKMTSKVRTRAKKLGVRRLAFKPTLSKLDPVQYEADLRQLASTLRTYFAEMARTETTAQHDSEPSKAEEGRNARLLDFLTSMTERLVSPRHKGDLSRTVLQVATKYLERGILFIRKKDQLQGLGGFGLADSRKDNFDVAQSLQMPLNRVEPLAEVVHTRCSVRLVENIGSLDQTLYTVIGRGQAQECIVIPLLHNNEVLAVLYGDNAVTGRRIGKLRGLELFLAQAGMALENLTLHRRLDIFQSMLTPKRDGVTQR